MQMTHLTMDKPQCLLYSAAMVLGADVSEITGHIGHDGMDIVDPNILEPNCFRGIHPQEICDFAWSTNRHLQYIQAMPSLAAKGSEVVTGVYSQEAAYTRFSECLDGRFAIIIGLTMKGNEHAVAWDGSKILDPIGRSYELDQFQVREAWVLI